MLSAPSFLRSTAHVALCLLFVASAHAADAEDAGVLEARRLRAASADDWAASRYAEAARKLASAAAIYEATPDRYVADLAVTRRALVWNLARAGELPSAHTTFQLLLAGGADDTTKQEIWIAYGAFLEAARNASTVASARDALEPVRTHARAAQRADLASQVLHDLGTIATAREPDTARKWLEEAVAERREARAPTELAYSLNNLAALHLQEGRLDAAFLPVLEAHRIVTEAHAVQPQAEVAATIATALERLRAQPTTTATQRTWLVDVAETSAHSDLVAIHRPETLLRAWLRLEATTGTSATRLAAANRLAGLVATPTEATPEIRADLLLHAATVAVAEGGATDALGWLGSIETGAGAAKPHLEARRAWLVAQARCAQRQTGEARAALTRAREALAAAGDRLLQLEGLTSMAKAARSAGLDDVAVALEEEVVRVRATPASGTSASAKSGGDREKFQALPLHGVVFELRQHPERGLLLRDELTGDETPLDAAFVRRSISLNGLTLDTFGPYVRIASLAYGTGGSASSSSADVRDLASLEPYLVVPGRGKLHLLKNGAVSYVP